MGAAPIAVDRRWPFASQRRPRGRVGNGRTLLVLAWHFGSAMADQGPFANYARSIHAEANEDIRRYMLDRLGDGRGAVEVGSVWQALAFRVGNSTPPRHARRNFLRDEMFIKFDLPVSDRGARADWPATGTTLLQPITSRRLFAPDGGEQGPPRAVPDCPEIAPKARGVQGEPYKSSVGGDGGIRIPQFLGPNPTFPTVYPRPYPRLSGSAVGALS